MVHYFGIRHLQCLMLFTGLAVSYMMRVNLSVAIVVMMDKSEGKAEFDWTEQIKSMLLSSFFWGYFITQIPGAQLAYIFGGKILLIFAVSINVILSILSPVSAGVFGFWLLLIIRILQGLVQGCVYPCIHTLMSKWVPPEELAVWGTFCITGALFGAALMMALSGPIVDSFMGWPGIFYVSGLLGLLWTLVFFFFGASSPAESKLISEAEKDLIHEGFLSKSKSADREFPAPVKTPWLQIFTSLPFIATLVCQCTYTWTLWLMLTQIPSYVNGVLKMDVNNNGLLSSLPIIAKLIVTYIFSGIDIVLHNYAVSLKIRRKVFNTIGQWVSGIFLIALGSVTNEIWEVILLTASVGFTAGENLGFLVNHVDLSPNFAGILMGIANCFANVMSLLAPLVVGVVVTDTSNTDQWRIIFFLSAGMFFFSNTLFLIFGKASPQPWNFAKTEQESQK